MAPFLLYQALGLLGFGLGAGLMAIGLPALAAAAMGIGVLSSGLGLSGWRHEGGAEALASSWSLIGLGRLADAEAVLDAAEKRYLGPNRARFLEQRALIALRRGDLAAALAHVDAAVRRLGIDRAPALLLTDARGMRAFVRAALGDAEGARADIAAVRAQPDPFVSALGLSALAEATLLDRAGDRAGLCAVLEQHNDSLLVGTEPRERAIVRAYQRMVHATATTPYRQSARRQDARAEEPPLVEWVTKIAPGAAAFVRVPAPASGGVPVPCPRATDEARRAVAEAHRRVPPGARARRARLVVLGMHGLVGLSVGFFAGLPGLVLGVVLGVAVLAVGGGMLAQEHREGLRLRRAASGIWTRPAQAQAELAALSRSPVLAVRARAHLFLAVSSDYSGDPAGLLDHSERGLGEVSTRWAEALAGDTKPWLAAHRAFGLAAMDRFDEAQAEIDAIPTWFPALAGVRFRVRLLTLVRQGNLDAARRLAEREAQDLPLGPRDELLADAVRVAVAPGACGAAEVLRVKEDLRVAEHRRWLEAFAPGLLHTVEHASENEDGDRPAQEEADGAHEEAEHARDEAALAEATAGVRLMRA